MNAREVAPSLPNIYTIPTGPIRSVSAIPMLPEEYILIDFLITKFLDLI